MRPVADTARAAIRVYRVTLSALIGRQCRHLPSCSEYAEEAIGRHGLWAGGWMATARICRCNPLGTHGLDFVPAALPRDTAWYRPWRYGRWRGTHSSPPVVCEPSEPARGDEPPAS